MNVKAVSPYTGVGTLKITQSRGPLTVVFGLPSCTGKTVSLYRHYIYTCIYIIP